MKVRPVRILVAVAVLVLVGYLFRSRLIALLLPTQAPPAEQAGARLADVPQGFAIVATGLDIPWEIAFLPDRSLLVTERPGRLTHITGDRKQSYEVEGVRHVGEGGLMGLALHPRFEENRLLYLYLTTAGGAVQNQVVRYRFTASGPRAGLSDRTVILGGIPAALFHNGGRIEFGPDGFLYITTGDATDASFSQDPGALGGKILRLTDDGKPAPGNPRKTSTYSWGHRNPQGLAWDAEGRLWATEHGRSGVESGFDELNLIQPGGNYGWPAYQGDAVGPGIAAPEIHSGPSYTWGPAGAAFRDGRILFGGLRGEALYEARILPGDKVDLRVHFHAELGRIRVVRLGPDGMLYLATSNRDGRGRTRSGDDKIVTMDPAFFSR